MKSDPQSNAPAATAHPFTSADILAILRERGWLTTDPTPEIEAWCAHAAAILGTQAADRTALAELLALVFHYDAQQILARTETHEVLARYAARDVLRHLALLLLDGAPLNSERFKEIITTLKQKLELPGRELLYPLRLALAGRPGDGSLDRVILLLDEAAVLPFAVPVKSARARILEFCAALD
jgi:anticodon-binding protein